MQNWEQIEREERPQAKRIAEWVALRHAGKYVLDVGCGPGLYVEEMRAVGLEAFGVDNDPRLQEGPYLKRVDIVDWGLRRISFRSAAISFRSAAITLSLEVGEHIPEDDADAYVNFLAGTNCTFLYFSAARPGQGGIGHVNCQPKAYWVEKLHRRGFWLEPDLTEEWLSFMRRRPHMGWLTQNGMVFHAG